MKNDLRKIVSKAKDDIYKNKLQYLLVAVILIIAVGLRVWRIDQLLGFYYDQGRDALVIEEILKGDIVLIGPTTGIEGVFLGPFYYYFMVPGYFLGQGNPVVASYWQTTFIVLGLITTFLIARLSFSLKVALWSLLLMTFSFSQIKLDRWLSNPVPATLFAPLSILLLSLSFKYSLPYLPLAALSLGILLQLEASSSFFLVLMTFLLILFYRKHFNFRAVFISLLVFGLTFLPQAVFELKNNFLTTKTIISFITGGVQTENTSTFQFPTGQTLESRLNLYSSTFLEKMKLNFDHDFSLLFVVFLAVSLLLVKTNWEKPAVKVAAWWFYGLLLVFLFYNGNYGQIHSYYFITVFPVFFIFTALILDWLSKFNFLKPVVTLLLILFIWDQLPISLSYLSSGVEGRTTVALGNQVKAVKYVLDDAGDRPYNWDAYVPPVIPYSYTYLFGYYEKKFGKMPLSEMTNNLYTLHEIDTSSPERELEWLKRQEAIGKIVKQVNFGGVSVERRERIKY